MVIIFHSYVKLPEGKSTHKSTHKSCAMRSDARVRFGPGHGPRRVAGAAQVLGPAPGAEGGMCVMYMCV